MNSLPFRELLSDGGVGSLLSSSKDTLAKEGKGALECSTVPGLRFELEETPNASGVVKRRKEDNEKETGE